MTQKQRRRPCRSEEGFTLIELMVVVLILAVLMAVAMPSFLSARNRAQDRAAQTLVRTALSAEIVFYGGSQRFSEDATPGGELASIEPDLAWGTVDASAKGVAAALDAGNDQAVTLRSQSRTGTTYCIGRIESGPNAGTYYNTACDGTDDEASIAAWPTTIAVGW
ncbi:MAG TPA: type II secretion system protein [Actinomycetota bacterium]